MRKSRKYRGCLAPDKYLSAEQVKKLRIYLRSMGEKNRAKVSEAMIDLMLNTGLRTEEVINLRMKDMPHYHGKFFVNVFKGKGNVNRAVAVSAKFAARMNKFVNYYRKNSKPKSFLFVNEDRQQFSYRSIYSRISIIGKRVGIKITPHMLRHTYAMQYYANTKDLFGLQQQLGHADTRTTHIYAKTNDETLRQQIELFDL